MKTSKIKTFILMLSIFILFSFISSDIFAATGPVSVSISSNSTNVNKGQKFTLTWNSTNTDSCVAHSNIQSPWYGIRSISGNETITPTQSATYFITCSNISGFSGVAQTTVAVGEFQSSSIGVNLTANPESIFRGESATLAWSSTNAVSCEASGYWSGLKPPFGSEVVLPSTTVSYALRCNNNLGQSASDTQTIFVNPSGSTLIIPPSNQFNVACIASPNLASVGQTVTFAGAHSYGAEPANYRWSGDVSGNTQSVKTSFSTLGTKTAQLTVTDAVGKIDSATCSVQVVSGGSVSPITIIKASKLPAPTNLKPNGDEFSSDTKEVALSWDSVKGAKFYAVRMDPENKTDVRDEKNDCPTSPHYLCVNNLDSTSLKVKVEAGNNYNWWVHAIDASGIFSNAASAKFSVKTKEVGTRDNFLANIFSVFSGQGIIFWILIILAYVIGYMVGKSKRTSLSL